jgi:hypothetical protein
MKAFIYANPKSGEWPRLRRAISSVVPGCVAKVCHDIRSLSTYLALPGSRNNVGVLCISNVQELDQILMIRDLISESRIILLLPDRNKETVSKGHRFYPRFLSYMDGDFSDVSAVLQKMLAMDRFQIRRDISQHE